MSKDHRNFRIEPITREYHEEINQIVSKWTFRNADAWWSGTPVEVREWALHQLVEKNLVVPWSDVTFREIIKLTFEWDDHLIFATLRETLRERPKDPAHV